METKKPTKAIGMLQALSSGEAQVSQNAGVQQMQIVAPDVNDSCQPIAPTKSNNINVGNLKNGGGDVVTFEVTNGAATPKKLIFGLGLVNITGNPQKFGIDNAAVDEALVIDQFGAGTAKMEFFSLFSAGHSYIASSIKIFVAAGSAQRSVAPAFATITPNGDFLEVRAKNIKDNADLNYIELAGCHIPLTFYQGVTYTLGAGVTITAEINVLGIDMIGNFGEGLGR